MLDVKARGRWFDSIPGGGTIFHFDFFAHFPWLRLGEDHKNEIKHDMHLE